MNIPNEIDPQDSPPRLFTFVGTAYLYLLKFLNVLPKGVYIVIDAKSELEAIRLDDDSEHVFIKLALEPRIAQDIVAQVGNAAQIEALDAKPNVSTQNGCCQTRGIGGAAVVCVVDRIDFPNLFHNLVMPELLRMAGGKQKCVNHMHFSGAAGGMGSAGGIVLLQAIQNLFVEPTDPELKSNVFVLGGLTFCSPYFSRTTENASCAMAEWIHLVRHPVSHRISTVLHAHELPPLELDKDMRNALLLQFFAAMFAGGFIEDQQTNSTNFQVRGNVGGAHLQRVDHFSAIAKSRVAGAIARNYLPLIRGIMLEKADVDSVRQVAFVQRHRRLKRESIMSIMLTAIELPIDEVIAATVAPSRMYYFQLRVRLVNGKVFDMEHLKLTFGTPIRTEKEAAKRLRELRTCYEVCFRELEGLEKQLDEASEDCEWAMEGAVVALRRMQGGWLGWIGSGFKSFEQRASHAEQALERLRKASDVVLELQAKIAATERTLDNLSEEIGLLVSKLTLLAKRLKSCLPKGDERRDPKLVVPLPLAERFADLLRYAESAAPTKERLIDLLSTAVACVTIEGLADIARCEPSIDAIVGSVLARKNVEHRCPAWGGETQLNPAFEKIVFPPVSPELRMKIQKHAGTDSRLIAFADLASGSPNIVCIETVYAEEASDVVTPFYDAGVRRALSSTLAPLLVVNSAAFEELNYKLPPSITCAAGNHGQLELAHKKESK